MLRCKNVHLIYQDSSAEVKIIKGYFQGGVLLPLLQCMVVDSLLPQLNAEGYLTQGFADYLVRWWW